MTDLVRPIAFGGSVDPTTADPTWPVRLTQTIEAAGLTFVGIQDHPYNLKFFDTLDPPGYPGSSHQPGALLPRCG